MGRIRQKAEPATDFPNDPMMRQLHQTRVKIYSETKDMDDRKLREYFQRKSEEFRKLSNK